MQSLPRSRAVRGAIAIGAATALMVPALLASTASADGHEQYFERIATFPVYLNNADPGDEVVAEIVDYWSNGQQLVYTDGEGGQIGFVDLETPTAPGALPGDNVSLGGGEPTSVAVVENASRSLKSDYALVGVNTSESFIDPSGELVVIDLATKSIAATLELGGQPDSLKVSPSGDYLAIAIENERDEDVVVPDPELGDVEGGLPQPPPGLLQVVKLRGKPENWKVRDVDLTGFDMYGSDDPEPEFVDIDENDIAVVSMQENNHLALVDLSTRTVVGDFTAGSVDLFDVDAVEDDLIIFRDSAGDPGLDANLADVPREPDAIAWIGPYVATANEGDLFGGSRGFSLFDTDGDVVFDSGNEFDDLARVIGHYPDGRSGNKGSEPESIAYGEFEGEGYLFVGSERGSYIGVYTGADTGAPMYHQVLPAGLGPEGLLTIPERDLLVVSSEVDDPTFGVRATITIYEYGAESAAYPEVMATDTLVDDDGNGVGWSAMSGMVATGDGSTAYAVWDSFYSESKIFEVDLEADPALVTAQHPITDGTNPVGYDLEGIALDGEGGFWVVSEGAVSGSLNTTPNLLLRINGDFEVVEEIGLPEEVVLCRQATVDLADEIDDEDSPEYAAARNLRFGFEGVTVDGDGKVLVAQQRGWEFADATVETSVGTVDCSELSTENGSGTGEVGVTKVWVYDPDSGEWTNVDYELDPKPAIAAWVGLSEITHVDDSLVFIERDNRTGDWATVKTLTKVDVAALDDGMIEADEQAVEDILPTMQETNGWISDKPEGTAIIDGDVFVITDNDGVDDWSGETQLLRLGPLEGLFVD